MGPCLLIVRRRVAGRVTVAMFPTHSFLSNLEATQWLFYLCQLLSVACEVVTALHDIARPVLVHCSDGWDRTPQVVALAELMLDPYYRTIEVLVCLSVCLGIHLQFDN